MSQPEPSEPAPAPVTAPEDPAAAPAGTSSPTGPRRVVPYLIVHGAQGAIPWYTSTFTGVLRDGTITMPDGRIGHAELDFGGAVVYLADESPESLVAAPRPGERATVSLSLEVPDLDAVVHRAVGQGAILERPPTDHPYGRNAVVRDPFGHRWILLDKGSEPPSVTTIRHGDIGYVSLWEGDPDRAARFFAAVLGWPESRHREVPWAAVNHGFGGGVDHPTLFLCFAVDKLTSAIERVVAGGGRSEPPDLLPWGTTAMCTDPLGTRFALYELPPAGGGLRPAANGVTHGDVAYITMEVTQSASARAFYGSVLGWVFEQGGVDDGWIPRDVAPMVGLSGGHDRPTTVPSYRVDDLDGALQRVRAAGGTATEAVSEPYGRTSACTDDQGARFNLVQPP